jgi:phosphomevalonate kinase
MRVRAPGKLLLTGAYAVREGAPAIVVAVNRYAVADGYARPPSDRPPPAVNAALRGAQAPQVEAHGLYDGEQKLGLGSSAAVVVATLGLRAAEAGRDLVSPEVRTEIFERARAAHAEAPWGSSGVDVAASVHGGVLRFGLGPGAAASIRPVALPGALFVDAFWSGQSARTSDLRAAVDALRARDSRLYGRRIGTIADAAERAAIALDDGDPNAFLAAAGETGEGLSALGRDADAPIVPPRVVQLAEAAAHEGAIFMPSGAGGGDVAVFLSARPPSSTFLSRAYLFGMRSLSIGVDRAGVRVEDEVGGLDEY